MEGRFGLIGEIIMEKSIQGIVEIGEKPVVERRATARGVLHLKMKTGLAIQNGEVKKGDVLEASTIAAIQAVKDTPRIIPHCHPIPLEGCKVEWNWQQYNNGWGLICEVHVSAHYKTGIEMEALTGVSAGLLCALDMVKSMEKDDDGQYPHTKITDIEVIEKYKGQ
jgi:cyclic pyranopterin phosphate synthase